jgi:hypothetical protein
MTGDVDPVDDDVVCTRCGRRSRAGYTPPEEPCWEGDTRSPKHDWTVTAE